MTVLDITESLVAEEPEAPAGPKPVAPIGPRIEYFPTIPGVFQAFPTIHGDLRGSFMEIFRQDLLGTAFVQANHSRSRAGVLRGLHHHAKQSDAWYVIKGDAQVVLADLRDQTKKIPVVSVVLRADEPSVLLIPPGVAHGFLALTDVDLIYWVTHGYDSTDEFGVAWDSPALGSPWATTDPILSPRDQQNPSLEGGSGGVAAPLGADPCAPEAAIPLKRNEGGSGGVAAPLGADPCAPEAAIPLKKNAVVE